MSIIIIVSGAVVVLGGGGGGGDRWWYEVVASRYRKRPEPPRIINIGRRGRVWGPHPPREVLVVSFAVTVTVVLAGGGDLAFEPWSIPGYGG
jgi:hypothetical protein